MTRLAILFLIIHSLDCFGQADTAKSLRAFPVTSYFVAINDSLQLVQILVPDGVTIKEKQVGLLRGTYRDKHSDTIIIGTGRCQLIKGDYYYFTINNKNSGRLPREGDLLYTMVAGMPEYRGRFMKLASYYIGLQNVYENPFYDRNAIFSNWNRTDEASLVDSLVVDIHFTGNYFLENNPQMNVLINAGRYKGKMVLNTMKVCTPEDVTDFLDYMIVRPRLYAGRKWKISEIFATWLSEGAPTVMAR